MQGGVAAAAGGGLADVAGAPPLLVAAVVGDLEDAALVEVEPTVLALETLLKHPKQHFPAKTESG